MIDNHHTGNNNSVGELRVVPRKPRDVDPSAADYQSFTVRLPAELHHALRVVAADENKSLNELLTQVLQDWWQSKPDRKRFEEFLRARTSVRKP
jgi:predicted HicB family RNase H-like nuclease